MFLWLRIRYWLTQEERVRREHSRRAKLSWGWYIGANRCGVRFEVLFRWRERDNRTELALLVSLIVPVVKCAKITRAWQLDPNTSSSSSSPWEPACQELRKRRAHFNWALKLHSASRTVATLWHAAYIYSLSLSHPLTCSCIHTSPRLLLRLYNWKEKFFVLVAKQEGSYCCTVTSQNNFAVYSSEYFCVCLCGPVWICVFF